MRLFKKTGKEQAYAARMDSLRDYLRRNVFDKDALRHLNPEDFGGLVDVARFTDFGVFTAVQAAFCMGYKAGKGR